MARKVLNNIAGMRVLWDGMEVEDVTRITLPNLEHATTEIAANGMIADVEIPDMTHFKAMTLSIAHNNGVNCDKLSTPKKHRIEIRTARQKYDIPEAEIGHEPDRYRATVLHKTTTKGDLEKSNPYGSTDEFAVVRYEEIIDGKTVVLLDAMTGQVIINGKNYYDEVEQYLK